MKAFNDPTPRLAKFLSLFALVGAIPLGAQQAPAPTPPPASTQPAQGSVEASGPNEQQPLVLSPFEVDAAKDQGYFAQNTLAGTRLNNNIADLGSSITVVTKQQLEDTNSLNINDVFRYEANTEGARTYTPTSLVRTNFSDNLGGTGGTTGSYASGLDTGN